MRTIGSLSLVPLLLLGCSDSSEPDPEPSGMGDLGSLSLPSGKGSFRFGAASAATQIEDKNPNTDWHVFTQPTEDGGLGKGKGFVGDASKGFTNAVKDVELVTEIGLDSYRFSIEWARIEPKRDQIDQDAIAHGAPERHRTRETARGQQTDQAEGRQRMSHHGPQRSKRVTAVSCGSPAPQDRAPRSRN